MSGAARRSRLEAGFTLLEIMSVIAILAILMSILLYGIGKYRIKAYEEGTRGLIEQVRAALESYHGDFGAYPPDGFDPQEPAIRMAGGSKVAIHGSACLVYFLGVAQIIQTEVGEDVRQKIVGPYLELKESMISGDGDLDLRIASPKTEIIDAWGNPIHYDRVDLDQKSGLPKIDDQTPSSVHTMPGFIADRMHGPDPRKATGRLMTKNAGAYDIWSHGADVTDPTRAITNWTE
jgi:prepilin-type N-terminal cleavage/methylation domain-containing protein